MFGPQAGYSWLISEVIVFSLEYCVLLIKDFRYWLLGSRLLIFLRKFFKSPIDVLLLLFWLLPNYLVSHHLLFLEIMGARRKDQYLPPRKSMNLFEPLGMWSTPQKSMPYSTEMIWNNSGTHLLIEGKNLHLIHNVSLSHNVLPGTQCSENV